MVRDHRSEKTFIALSAFVHGSVILLVEDDPHVAEAIQSLLGDLGAAVLVAHDSAQALDHLKTAAPDLIMSDVRMPRVDGWQLVRKVRAKPTMHALPVMSVSALSSDVDCDRLRAAGFDACLCKPFDDGDLAAPLHTLMRRRPWLFQRQCERLRAHAAQQRRHSESLRQRAITAKRRAAALTTRSRPALAA